MILLNFFHRLFFFMWRVCSIAERCHFRDGDPSPARRRESQRVLKKNRNALFWTLPLPQTSSGVPSNKCWIIQTRLAAEITLLGIQSQQLVSSVDLISQLGGGWSAAQLDRPDRGVPSH